MILEVFNCSTTKTCFPYKKLLIHTITDTIDGGFCAQKLSDLDNENLVIIDARGVWFVLKFIDRIKSIKVYDGSMLEYSKTLLPVEQGQPMSF